MTGPPPPHLLLGLGCLAVALGIGVGALTAPTPDAGGSAPETAVERAAEIARREIDAAALADDDCQPAPLPQRAGATLIVGIPGATSADHAAVDSAERAGVGGVLLTGANVVDRAQTARLVRGLRRRLGRDVLVVTDEETGRVSSFRGVVGPTRSPRTAAQRLTLAEWRARAEELGEELAAAGVDWNLAPVADVDDGPAGAAIGDRSFSGDPEEAADYAAAFAAGMADAGVIPTAKHFPGHGGVAGDPHHGRVTDRRTRRELRETHLPPFTALIDAGVPAMMTGHVVHTALDRHRPASLSPATYELLRDLGFSGVAITDSVGMGAIHQRYGYEGAAPRALAAGADAVLAGQAHAAPRMAEAIVAAVERGDLADARLDEAATRVLTLAGRDPETVTCREPPPDFPGGPGGRGGG